MELKCATMKCSDNHKMSLKLNKPYRTAFWNNGKKSRLCVNRINKKWTLRSNKYVYTIHVISVWFFYQNILYFLSLLSFLIVVWRTLWWRGLRHCTTSWKVVGSIPVGVIENFHWHNSSGRTMALGSTQPLTEKSTRNINWGLKVCRFPWNMGASTS
jgi:hypothetical protein